MAQAVLCDITKQLNKQLSKQASSQQPKKKKNYIKQARTEATN